MPRLSNALLATLTATSTLLPTAAFCQLADATISCSSVVADSGNAISLLESAALRARAGEEFAAANLVVAAESSGTLSMVQWDSALTILGRLRMTDAAVRITRRGIGRRPACPEYIVAHLEALRMAGQLDSALRHASRVTEVTLGSALLWAKRGQLEVLAGRHAAARTSFNAAHRADPSFIPSHPVYAMWESRAHLAAARASSQGRSPQ